MAIESPDGSDARMDMGALWAAVRHRLLRIVLVTLVLVGIGYALLLFVPKSYESSASILVESRDSVYTQPATTGNTPPPASPDAIISSQIELAKSRDTLLPVVKALNLAAVPEFNGTQGSSLGFLTRFLKKAGTANPEDVALDTLSDHLSVLRERDSALFSITVRSTDPVLAAKLANAIAKADVARRAELSLSDTADASVWLEQQITGMQKRVSDAETKVADFKINNDLYTGGNNTSLLDQQMTEISTQITEAQGRKDTAASRANLIRGLLAAGQPIDGVDDVRNSVTIQQLTQQKAQLAAQRAQLLATLLPSHPSVAAVTAQITAVDNQIAIEGKRVASALDAEAKIETNLLTSLQSNLADTKNKQADATRQTVELDALDREAKADRDLLESYMTRYRDAASRTDASSALPDVRVITLASPSSSPSAPKVSLILGAIAFVSLAGQVGAILFGELLSGRAVIEPGTWRAPTRRADEDEDEPAFEASADDAEEAALDGGMIEPEPGVAVAEEVPATAPQSERKLRTWFGKRARAVGSSLTAYEPPIIASAGPVAEAPEPAGEPASELAGVEAPADIDDLAIAEDDAAARANAARLANLSADLVLGRVRIVVLAALESQRDSEALADRLIGDALHRGLSVARVDAGSFRPSTEPGITDLSADAASFGDVVHKTAEEGLAEVPWGHLAWLDPHSSKPVTLVEALSDLYEVVVVLVGRAGYESSLSTFAGLSVRLVLVGALEGNGDRLASARAEVAKLGYRQVEAIAPPFRPAEVA